MEFFRILDKLKQQYSDNQIVRENGTILLDPNKIPRCRHMLFKPLKDEYIQNYLVDEYKNTFPKEYIEFLKYSNGANLNSVRIKSGKFCIAHSMFIIFGLPLTPPFNRKPDMEEPFDMRIEDLARHNDIPNTWLKCGTYIRDYNFDVTNDIFIDTVTGQVFACVKNEKDIIDSWNNLDECFCSIFNSFDSDKYEFVD